MSVWAGLTLKKQQVWMDYDWTFIAVYHGVQETACTTVCTLNVNLSCPHSSAFRE